MQPLTVSQVSNIVKSTVKDTPELQNISVRGEVTNYADRRHHYFSIKDGNATLRCVIWASRTSNISALPLENGAKVVLTGNITTYPAGSTYQLDVIGCELEGQGELYKKYLELKEKLLKEGLFDEENKKPIPMYPSSVGIVTSEKGAALQDMVRVFLVGKGVNISVQDSRVQGPGSADSISNGIIALDGKVDVIIIGRGGGSIEDLWAFNEEVLARAVFACKTPIISAVGHEVDEVITDYVADRRVSTPTAAAEFIVQNMNQVYDDYRDRVEGLHLTMLERLNNFRQYLDLNDIRLREKLMLSAIEGARKDLRALEDRSAFGISCKISHVKEQRSSVVTALRTTWIAALKEKGLAALYQDDKRVHDLSNIRKGGFTGLLKDGKIKGEVTELEV